MDVRRHPRREHSTKLLALSGAPGTGDDTRRGGGMVVATQQVAADAGREVLVAGGSAADAVVATAFASCVVDPSNCGVGGYGGFLVYAPAGEEPVAVEFNTWMPSRLDPTQLREPGSVGPVVRGGLAVAPPAVVPGLLEAHDRFGRRPRADVLAPAIRLARDGFPVGPYLAWALEQHLAQGGAGRGGDFDSLFYPGGEPRGRGSMLVQHDLAVTLEAIAERGADALRTGAIAAAICETACASGGVLTPGDLAADHVAVGRPATTTFAGARLYGPSRAGSGTGILFPALDEIDPDLLGENRGHAYMTALAEALRRAWTTRRATSRCARGPPSHHAPVHRGPGRRPRHADLHARSLVRLGSRRRRYRDRAQRRREPARPVGVRRTCRDEHGSDRRWTPSTARGLRSAQQAARGYRRCCSRRSSTSSASKRRSSRLSRHRISRFEPPTGRWRSNRNWPQPAARPRGPWR